VFRISFHCKDDSPCGISLLPLGFPILEGGLRGGVKSTALMTFNTFEEYDTLGIASNGKGGSIENPKTTHGIPSPDDDDKSDAAVLGDNCPPHYADGPEQVLSR